MHDNKLIQVLQVLSNKEMKKLYDFIDSPFFAQSEKVVSLFMYLKKYSTNWASPQIAKEKVYAVIFPKTAFNNLKFNQLCFEALDMMEEFYMHLYLNKNDIHSYHPLLDFYLKHNLSKHYESLFKFLTNKQEKSLKRDEEYLYQQWSLDICAARQESLQYIRQNQSKSYDMITGLDYFYFAKKIAYLCASISQKNIVKSPISVALEEEIIAYIFENELDKKIDIIRLYYPTYLMLKEQDADKNFDYLLTILPEYKEKIHSVESQNIYTAMQNFCIIQINKKGNIQYENQLLKLYKQQLNDELLYDNNNNIQAGIFKNIVVLGTRLRAFDWVYQFIENYGDKIPVEIREDVVGYCQALWAFEQKIYDKTLKILQLLDSSDIFFNIDSRKLLIKTYYEIEEYELVLSTTNTFRVFIHRDSILTETHKEANRNFANFVGKLVTTDNDKKIQKIQAELAEIPNVGERRWLQEKIGEKEALFGLSQKDKKLGGNVSV